MYLYIYFFSISSFLLTNDKNRLGLWEFWKLDRYTVKSRMLWRKRAKITSHRVGGVRWNQHVLIFPNDEKRDLFKELNIFLFFGPKKYKVYNLNSELEIICYKKH